LEENQVQVLVECSIFPGKVDEFKRLAQETIDAVKAGSKAVGYRWYFNSDETKCYIIEQHPDSALLIRQLEVVGIHLLRLLDASKVTRFEVFGSLGHLESAEKLLEKLATGLKITKLDWNPQNLEYWNGFVR
jgi:hypothetical protein